jgi:hypothetical protein
MSRLRVQRPVQGRSGRGLVAYNNLFWNAEAMWESSHPGPCEVHHYRVDKGITLRDQNDYEFTENWSPAWPAIPEPTRLNWGKLPTSTEFGLIQFFAELDDTLALFGMKFWRSLTYGSFTWGVLPFVSEVKALLEALSNLGTNLDSFDYEDSFDEEFPIENWSPFPDTMYGGSLSCKYHLYGKASLSFQHPGSLIADSLGFHPDLLTAWDLVPLSFAFDWLFPVGEYLDSLRGGGWVKAVPFTGWYSVKATYNGTFYQPSWGLKTCDIESYRYLRRPYSQVLVIHPPTQFDVYRIPSFKQMFNLVYLGGLGRKVGF